MTEKTLSQSFQKPNPMTGQRNRTKFLVNYIATCMSKPSHRIVNLHHLYRDKFEMANEAWERIDKVDHGQWVERMWHS